MDYEILSVWKAATLAVAIACASTTVATADEPSHGHALPEPEAEIQAQIRRTVEAMHSGGLVDASKELHRLKQIAGDSPGLVQQIAVYVATASGPDVMMAHLILHPCFPMDVDDATIVRGLADFVQSEHSDLREWVEDEFTRIDGVGSTLPKPVSPPDYGAYHKFIRSRLISGEALPVDMLSFIFRRAPGSALLATIHAIEDALDRTEESELLQQEEIRRLLLAEHIISDATWKKEHDFSQAFESARGEAGKELQTLADHDEWWVRLYATEILRRHPEFGTPEMLQQLRSDKHKAVREAFVR